MTYNKDNKYFQPNEELKREEKIRLYLKLESMEKDIHNMLLELYKFNRYLKKCKNSLYERERLEYVIKPLKEAKSIFLTHILETDYVKDLIKEKS